MSNISEKTIHVTGDPICDHGYYRGNRATADSPDPRGFRTVRSGGGALLLEKLISRTTGAIGWTTEFGLKLDYEKLPQDYHGFCLWEPQLSNPYEKNEAKQFRVWRAVTPTLGYGERQPAPDTEEGKARDNLARIKALGVRKVTTIAPEILVIDDAGLDFRRVDSKDRWPFSDGSRPDYCPRWIVLKLSGSIGEGDLWKALVSHSRNNLIVIVSADQLRRDDVRLSRGMSWEATVQDLLAELEANPALEPLLQARHVIVTFRSDGAFWLNNKDERARSSMLVFDAANAEGEWEGAQGKGGAFGYLSCFTAAITHQLCLPCQVDIPDFETALGAGLGACRELRRLGNGLTDNPVPGFPFDELADKIREPTETFVSAQFPFKISRRGSWMMLDEWQVHAHRGAHQRPHHEAAVAVAVLGPDALRRFPVARFGDLLTVDRHEIESLRSLRQILVAYENGGPQKRPLSLGVFGPPGAGKSFGVTQIARAVLGEKVEILTFNLSQFSNPADLNGAFHLIRDRVLTGVTPVVFWDEFDSQGYRWLQYLLAPMQDGSFQEGQISHPIGKCVFVFAGATSPTFEDFGPRDPNVMADTERNSLTVEQRRDIDDPWHEFVLKKGPDFKSRLVGYLNVLGPNPRQVCSEENGGRNWHDDSTDLCYPIRRAFLIRSQFNLKDTERLDIDHGVLRALLEISRHKLGSRSLEFLCQYLRQSRQAVPRRSHLPSEHLLNMHVNASEFWEICERDLPFLTVAPKLAFYLHEAYRLRIQRRVSKAHLDVEFSKLDVDMQAANLAQALRIPTNLRLVGLHLVRGDVVELTDLPSSRQAEEEPVRKCLTELETLDLLAEAEHNGWMVERMLRGWRYGRERDDNRKLHQLLIPYSQLSDADKDYDRQTISGKLPPEGKPNEEQFGYIDIVKTAGFRVAPLDPGTYASTVR